MNKDKIKSTLVDALKSEYGFAPYKSDIVLLEAGTQEGLCTYCLFEVRGKQYSFNSSVSNVAGLKTVWVGKGTIRRVEC